MNRTHRTILYLWLWIGSVSALAQVRYPQSILQQSSGWITQSLSDQQARIKQFSDSLKLHVYSYQIYNKAQSDARYMLSGSSVDYTTQVYGKPNTFASSIPLVSHLQDSLSSKLNLSDYRTLAAAQSAGSYSKAESNQLFAGKGTTLGQYNIGDAYTKLLADSLTLYRSVKYGPTAVRGDSLHDDTEAIRAIINNPGTGSAVFFPAGVYRITGTLFNRVNVQILLSPNARIITNTSFANVTYQGNDAGYALVNSTGGSIIGGEIDLKGTSTGGITMINAANARVAYVRVKNWVVGPGQARFGVNDVGGTNNRIEGCSVTDGVHAINAFRSNFTVISLNYTDRNYSGIYFVACTNGVIFNNLNYNDDDVGLDVERCNRVYLTGNYSQGCSKGEYAIYDGGPENGDQAPQQNIVFGTNFFYRPYTYRKANPTGTAAIIDSVDRDWGACSIHSLAAGAFNVGFDNMQGIVERGSVFKHYQTGDKSNRYVFFRNSHVFTKDRFYDMLNSDGVHLQNNTLEGLAGSESKENTIRDAHGLVMENEVYRYVNPKTSTYAVNLLTVSNFATLAPTVTNETFYNTNSRAFQVDLFNNGSLNPLLIRNTFSTDYQPNGGLNITANGNAMLRDQKLKVLLQSGTNDLSTVTGLSRSGYGKATGDIGYGRAGYNGSIYRLYALYGSGYFLETIFQAGGLTASISGNNLTLTNGTGTTINAFADITVNTYNP